MMGHDPSPSRLQTPVLDEAPFDPVPPERNGGLPYQGVSDADGARAGREPLDFDAEDARLRREIDLWQSPKMRELWGTIRQAARADITVLLRGETGTGKDVVARAIHACSLRRHAPYVRVNCAAVPHDLLESELFGHERGAFTGAHQLKIGKFEAANRGTIFLDEIAELHPGLQAKLLHILQDGSFSRVGAKASLTVDVRVLAATNRNLERAVTEERFRQDLYYRLNVLQIVMPPLRERMEEVPLLVEYFARRYAAQFNRSDFEVPASSIGRLVQYHYPGNIRELENIVKLMIVLDDPDLIRVPFPPQPLDGSAGQVSGPKAAAAVAAPTSLRDIGRSAARSAERDAIARTLTQTGWNRSRAAKLLRISYRALLYKIKEAGLDPPTQPTGPGL
jgi:two-component system response regulator AtoC